MVNNVRVLTTNYAQHQLEPIKPPFKWDEEIKQNDVSSRLLPIDCALRINNSTTDEFSTFPLLSNDSLNYILHTNDSFLYRLSSYDYYYMHMPDKNYARYQFSPIKPSFYWDDVKTLSQIPTFCCMLHTSDSANDELTSPNSPFNDSMTRTTSTDDSNHHNLSTNDSNHRTLSTNDSTTYS